MQIGFALLGISIFLGVLLSLGSTSAVANVVAGVILTYMRAFHLGDRVQIADTTGDVIEVSLLVTRIRTIKNVKVTIANSMVLGSHIINFSRSARDDGLILHTTVTIGYDAPWRVVHRLLIDAADQTENLLRAPRPFVFQTALNDF
jgi:small-conductance mechanosensitive channel